MRSPSAPTAASSWKLPRWRRWRSAAHPRSKRTGASRRSGEMTSMAPRLAVLASRVRFEEKSIMTALEKRGADVACVDPRSLFVIADTRWTGPEFVLNREVGHFRALYAASALEAAGAKVLNSSAATHISGDKWHTSAMLVRHGVPTPRTAVAVTP